MVLKINTHYIMPTVRSNLTLSQNGFPVKISFGLFTIYLPPFDSALTAFTEIRRNSANSRLKGLKTAVVFEGDKGPKFNSG